MPVLRLSSGLHLVPRGDSRLKQGLSCCLDLVQRKRRPLWGSSQHCTLLDHHSRMPNTSMPESIRKPKNQSDLATSSFFLPWLSSRFRGASVLRPTTRPIHLFMFLGHGRGRLRRWRGAGGGACGSQTREEVCSIGIIPSSQCMCMCNPL